MEGNSTNVLLIDNNAKDAEFIKELLSKAEGAPFKVECIARFPKALVRLSEEGIDVILLSICQPENENAGIELLEELHDQAIRVPTIVLTDIDDEASALKALQKGAQEYLIKKQLNSNMLARVLRYAIRRKRMLAELEQNKQRQLQLKEQFLSHVSHELRLPLAVIYQFVTILLDEIAGEINQDQREYLEITLRNVNQLRSMIGDLLEITRAETGKLTIETRCISIDKIIAETLKIFQGHAAQKSISLTANVTNNFPPVYADPERVRQILGNIINNGIKFTPENGKINIGIEVWDENIKYLCISVADTGCGIKPKNTQMIFDRLYQEVPTSEVSRKGLGLGLYICKELVTRHGGQIWVESHPGRGSTFFFTLPIYFLSNLLIPVLIDNDRLRTPVALIRVDVHPADGSDIKISESTLREAWDVLQRCTLPDMDVLLPRMGRSKEGETFFLVACADYRGIEVLVRRIQQQLARCEDLRDIGIIPKVSSIMVEVPPDQGKKTLEQVADDIVSNIEKLVFPKEKTL